MPIYAYRCETCGFAKDVLQKLSDPVLTDCMSCGKPTLKKQLTAAGFQLKGTGWYVTDFRGGNTTGAPAPAGNGSATESDAKPAAAVAGSSATESKTESKAASTSDAKPAASSAAKPESSS